MSGVREGSSRSKRRVALALLGRVKTLKGCPGGDARGAAEGAKPHNRPHLAARRAGVPNFAGRRKTVPEGRVKPSNGIQPYFPARRAGVPRIAGGRNPCPEGELIQSMAFSPIPPLAT